MYMPDQSCRSCGGELGNHATCSDCRKSIQKKCTACNHVTPLQPHQYCMKGHEPQKQALVQVVQKNRISKTKSVHFSFLAVAIVGFFILGLAANTSYNEIPQVVPDEAQATNSSTITRAPSLPVISGQSYDNCLAYGSGESITVTCPTNKGFVYKAILNMPQDLKKNFADSVFSIRGVSVTESSDGSVVLQYHVKNYVTNYFGN